MVLKIVGLYSPQPRIVLARTWKPYSVLGRNGAKFTYWTGVNLLLALAESSPRTKHFTWKRLFEPYKINVDLLLSFWKNDEIGDDKTWNFPLKRDIWWYQLKLHQTTPAIWQNVTQIWLKIVEIGVKMILMIRISQ